MRCGFFTGEATPTPCQTLVERHNRLEELVLWIFEQTKEHMEVDSMDIFEKAVKLGILVTVPYNPQVHGTEHDLEEGDTLYKMAWGVRAFQDKERS